MVTHAQFSRPASVPILPLTHKTDTGTCSFSELWGASIPRGKGRPPPDRRRHVRWSAPTPHREWEGIFPQCERVSGHVDDVVAWGLPDLTVVSAHPLLAHQHRGTHYSRNQLVVEFSRENSTKIITNTYYWTRN